MATGTAGAVKRGWEILDAATAVRKDGDELLWYDVRQLGIGGKGWTDTETPFDRLPAKAKGVVRQPVWDLSQNSAGLRVDFMTEAGTIHGCWRLRSSGLAMAHMPASGVSGIDLYARVGGRWRWVGNGIPAQVENRAALLTSAPVWREYRLYLPLYNGVESLEIGVPAGARIAKAPASRRALRPIVFYGTSIVQGGCAARPGMVYTSILERWLDWPAINLGFSGNGILEPEMVQLMAELDPAVYVMDSLPNMDAKGVSERIEPAVRQLRAAHPRTPIVLVENIIYQRTLPGVPAGEAIKNRALRQAVRNLRRAGIQGLHLVPCDDLLGHDWEGTVDGTHATDVGFLRMAQVLLPYLRRLVRKGR